MTDHQQLLAEAVKEAERIRTAYAVMTPPGNLLARSPSLLDRLIAAVRELSEERDRWRHITGASTPHEYRDALVRLEAENALLRVERARLKAANGHLQQELVMRPER